MATTITITNVGQKPPPVAISASEEAITVTSTNFPNPWVFTLVCSSAWFYNSVSSQPNPMPVAANQPLTFAMKEGKNFVFYATHGTTGNLHLLVVQ